MNPQPSTRLIRILTLVAALPLAFTLSSCSVWFSDSSGSGASDSGTEASATQSASSSSTEDTTSEATLPLPENGRVDTSTVLASRDVTVDGTKARIDLNAIIVKDGMTTLTMTLVNTDSTEISMWPQELGSMYATLGPRYVEMIDVDNRLIYKPGLTQESDCLCSDWPKHDNLEPGGSRVLWTTFEALPEGVDTVTVKYQPVQALFEDAPVTRK